jgi:hypothetical protein
MSNKQPSQIGSMYEKKDPEIQRNNFAKKEFFEEQRNVQPDYKFGKNGPDANFLHPEVSNYRNSGLSPNKYIDLNLSKEQNKESVGRPQLDDANKRNLMMLLENFHTTLVNNQQKLENELKKDRKANNTNPK